MLFNEIDPPSSSSQSFRNKISVTRPCGLRKVQPRWRAFYLCYTAYGPLAIDYSLVLLLIPEIIIWLLFYILYFDLLLWKINTLFSAIQLRNCTDVCLVEGDIRVYDMLADNSHCGAPSQHATSAGRCSTWSCARAGPTATPASWCIRAGPTAVRSHRSPNCRLSLSLSLATVVRSVRGVQSTCSRWRAPRAPRRPRARSTRRSRCGPTTGASACSR